jgi:NMD protein affecting ribosome stability and mRNA decay
VNDVLGDEADLALCENCHKELELDDEAHVVVCGGCAGVYCRKICWADHWCGPLTDRNGRIVRLGQLMYHHDDFKFRHGQPAHVYRVVEMSESFRKHALAVGVEVKGKTAQRVPLHTRLMEIKDDV